MFFDCIFYQPHNFEYLSICRYHVPRSWLRATNNLFVIFEETDKTPFDISIKSRYTKTICAQISEDHYPPLDIWSGPALVKGMLNASDVAPVMHLNCEDGYSISSIDFASYGTPQGSCQKFSIGSCHATNSFSVLSKVCHTLIKS